MRNNGINYLNAAHPYGNCSTAQGHAGLTTGTFPSYHGITNNEWIDVDGVSFKGAVQDNDLSISAVFDPTNGKKVLGRSWRDAGDKSGYWFYYSPGPLVAPTFTPQGSGISPRNYVADTLSDQLMLYSTNELKTSVYALSMDAETSTLMAGRLGKAIWMDNVSGLFTTSRYYFPGGIPDWVNQFNSSHPVPASMTWNPVYPVGSAAYQFPNAQDYSGSALPDLGAIIGVPLPSGTLFGQTVPSIVPLFGAGFYANYPVGIQTYFAFVKQALDQLLSNDPNSRLVLWLNVVAFDTLAGLMGTQVQESIDLIYQIDQMLGDLMKYIQQKISLADCLFYFAMMRLNIRAYQKFFIIKDLDWP